MITADVTIKGKAQIDPGAHVGFMEHGGSIEMGNNVTVRHGCILRTCGGKITIGENVLINYGCIMHGLGGITIGNNVLLSPCVQIYAQNHGIKRSGLIRAQKQTGKGVTIGDDVWIGAGAIILDGVTIGKGAVVGANAVITKAIPPYETWGGNPARKIGDRK